MPTCTRLARTTGRLCLRKAAEWPHHEDLPAPVVACSSHLTPEEWAACQQARARTGGELAARWAAERAAREERGEKTQPEAAPSDCADRPCTGQCVSQARAWGRDADSALSLCAACDGFVCLNCGKTEVHGELEICDRCEQREADDYEAAIALWDDETDTGSDPRVQLSAVVTQIIAATRASYSFANARINRSIGVNTRVGADEQTIRRALWAARAWLHEVQPDPKQAVSAVPDAPDLTGRQCPPSPLHRQASLHLETGDQNTRTSPSSTAPTTPAAMTVTSTPNRPSPSV
ncbi:hypothetical protein [Streptomyces arboris]|uniref:hypothetical protein n=1 Tax=Streptomyces arboris TaxID=2600619 RepID=UPI003BF606E3